MSTHADECSESGNEHRCAGRNSIVTQHQDVPHLVDVDRQYDADGEGPSVQRPIDANEGEHRKQRADFGEAEQQKFSFAQQKQQSWTDTSRAFSPLRSALRLRAWL